MATAGRITPIVAMKPKTEPARATQPTQVPLIFELSTEDRRGTDLAARTAGNRSGAEILGSELCRTDLVGFPELSEPQVLRHFLRLSQTNFAQALQFYPLGSCTMKYNPVVNDEMAALEGFASIHPLTPAHLAQGALELMARLEAALAEITGMDAISLHPAAGAQGELTGLLVMRAYHRKRGENRHKVIIPDTAHGTNPASCTLAGFEVLVARSNSRGFLDADEVRRLAGPDVAAMMVTNPNTLGLFEPEICEIAHLLHEQGALLYMDGANMNALVGKVRPGDFGVDVMHLNLHKTFSTPHGGGGPGSGPVAIKRALEPFLPTPVLITKSDGTLGFEYNRPQSVGRVRSFYGNFGMFVRALAYIMANGPDGLRQTTEDAVLNANYIRKGLEGAYDLPYSTPSMHEVVFSDKLQAKKGVKTMDIAKRLIDYGFHPYTTAFPLIVPGALMIEPTESEDKTELDLFVDAMKSIAQEVEEDPQIVLEAPHSTRVSRLDETAAARKPVLRWKQG
jgi:glycine dehydrogenase subunit 2